jgi:hypothetical protein
MTAWILPSRAASVDAKRCAMAGANFFENWAAGRRKAAGRAAARRPLEKSQWRAQWLNARNIRDGPYLLSIVWGKERCGWVMDAVEAEVLESSEDRE